MKTLEQNDRLPAWLNSFLNALCVDMDNIRTASVSWGANETSDASPDVSSLHREGRQSLFYNGIIFVRLVWPLGFWLQLKWNRDHRFQTGWGYKVNGRVGLTFRYQSTGSAARGTTGPNYGQAPGWMRGTT